MYLCPERLVAQQAVVSPCVKFLWVDYEVLAPRSTAAFILSLMRQTAPTEETVPVWSADQQPQHRVKFSVDR